MRLVLARFLSIAVLLAASATQAATYYVRNGGSDKADGLSHETAWASLSKVNGFSFRTGDSVLFEEGGRWEGKFTVTWSGTAAKPVVIGAYYLDGGTPKPGFRNQRPIIDGADKIPTQFEPLVGVKQADHVRIENLEVVNSEGWGIQFGEAHHGRIDNCIVDNTFKSGIKIIDSDYAVITRNFVSRTGMGHVEADAIWGGVIELVRSDNGLVRGNTVSEVYGEGINANDGSSGTIIEENHVFAARAIGIYLDVAPNSIVRRNLVVGTANSEFWRGGNAVGAGIVLNNESYHYANGRIPKSVQTRNVKIYNNLVAYTNAGIAFWGGQVDETSFENVWIFNNTLVDNELQLRLRARPKPGSLFINNILLSLSAGARDVDDDGKPAGLSANNNYFSQGDPKNGLGHASDTYSGLQLARMSGWRSAMKVGDIQWSDFLPTENSTIVGAGSDDLYKLAQSEQDEFHMDFNKQAHNRPIDLGGLRPSSIPVRTPKYPTDVLAIPQY